MQNQIIPEVGVSYDVKNHNGKVFICKCLKHKPPINENGFVEAWLFEVDNKSFEWVFDFQLGKEFNIINIVQ